MKQEHVSRSNLFPCKSLTPSMLSGRVLLFSHCMVSRVDVVLDILIHTTVNVISVYL